MIDLAVNQPSECRSLTRPNLVIPLFQNPTAMRTKEKCPVGLVRAFEKESMLNQPKLKEYFGRSIKRTAEWKIVLFIDFGEPAAATAAGGYLFCGHFFAFKKSQAVLLWLRQLVEQNGRLSVAAVTL